MGENVDNAVQDAAGSIPGVDDKVRPGGINQGQGSGVGGELNDTDPKDAETLARHKAISDLTDDNAASHQGGFGAQGGQADFGSAGNLAGVNTKTGPGGV